MKRRKFLLLGFFLLALASCSQQSNVDTGSRSTVTLTIQFPQPSAQSTGLTPLGVPRSASEATVNIYNAQNVRVATRTLTPSQSSTTINLLNGSYAFETSVKRSGGTEIAWSKENYTISSNTVISLKPKAILGEAWLSHSLNGPLSPNEEVNIRLWVVEPGETQGNSDGSFPIEDYEVTYALGTCSTPSCTDFTPSSAATIVRQTKTGVAVKANTVSQDTTVYVRARVTGLGTNRQPTALDRYTSFTIPANSNVGINLDFVPPQVTLNAPSSLTVGQVANFSGTASDTGGRVRELRVYVNSQEITPSVTPSLPAASVSFTFSFTPSQPGRYDIDILAFDEAGNSQRYYTSLNAQ